MADYIADIQNTYMSNQRKARLVKFGTGLALLVFGFWTVSFLNIPMERLFGLFGRLGPMLANRIFPPDMAYATEWNILLSLVETIEMSVLGAFYGTVIAIPLSSIGVTPSASKSDGFADSSDTTIGCDSSIVSCCATGEVAVEEQPTTNALNNARNNLSFKPISHPTITY